MNITGHIKEHTALGVPLTGLESVQTPLSRLKAKFRGHGLTGVPSVMSAPPIISTGSANGDPATSTVRVIPWDGNAPQVNHIFNSPFVWAYNSTNITGTRATLQTATQNSQERFLFSTPIFPTNSGNLGTSCMHFIFDGQVLEICSLTNVQYLIVCDGQLVTSTYSTISVAQAWTKFDFGSRKQRYISVYTKGQIGSISIGLNDSIAPWDRSKDINAVYHGDSYGLGAGEFLPNGGPFEDAFLKLGLSSWWGSGYSGAGYYNAGSTSAAAAAFADLGAVDQCDLWLVGLGINETRSTIGASLYDSTVLSYYQSVRNAFPNAVIAATGPWAPLESVAKTAVRTDISASVYAQLQLISGPWVFMDNLTGNWYNSSGVTGRQKVASSSSTTTVNGGPSTNTLSQTPTQAGTWQTGEGRVGTTTGKGNGDLYISSDGTHPSTAGYSYLGSMIAINLRQGILNL